MDLRYNGLALVPQEGMIGKRRGLMAHDSYLDLLVIAGGSIGLYRRDSQN